MTDRETPHQRDMRLAAERRARQEQRTKQFARERERPFREAARIERAARRERRYLDALVDDHNHDMDG